ncbi:glycoside hydrolase family 5 protein [Cohnella ginsengisoli]|uniref:Exo-1,3-beta-glucanase D n=1 Tax=Cohnella ginsengisoli TaxID=425004 RepID=A0A9X4KF66_9BACL|nr:glycoside hydrolase family 5 protein [Cohnella ginsengisoli]MDG0790947.1 glycoside hydrolase family 5 protein [Cohnella ginsengisoli]
MSENETVNAVRGGNGDVYGYVRADGRVLRNGRGEEIVLRGVGFGSWLLPEGYMWRFPQGGDRPRRIERMIRELVGEEKAARFWGLYYDRYVAEADIAWIAAEGFNSVRVPLLARTLLEEREPVRFKPDMIARIDQVVRWCERYGLYVILDLHGAPGGQTGTNIDDSERDLPELFLDAANRMRTVALWRLLAARYRDEWIVAGYDLLNEPLPEWFAAHNDSVMPFYEEVIAAIRELDDRHMIILEGVHWATDWSIFDALPDSNVLLQFHKYWNAPDTASIQVYLDHRERLNAPLFMGEGGENNKDWYAGAFRLFEDHGISWNFWTWKKMDTDNSPCSIRRPEGWELLVRYLEGGDKPTPAEAERILWAYLDNLPLDRCDYEPAVVSSLFVRAPVRIPAAFYGYKGEGASYGFGARSLSEGDRAADGNRSELPALGAGARAEGFRTADGTDIRFVVPGRTTPNFQHGGGEEWQADEWMYVALQPGDWLAYGCEAAGARAAADGGGSPERSAIRLRVLSEGGGKLYVSDGRGAPATAVEWQEGGWHTVTAEVARSGIAGAAGRIVIEAADRPVGVAWLALLI